MNPVSFTSPVRGADMSSVDGLLDKRADPGAATDFASDLARCLGPGCSTNPSIPSPNAMPADRAAPRKGRSANDNDASQDPKRALDGADLDTETSLLDRAEEGSMPEPSVDSGSAELQNAVVMLAWIQDASVPVPARPVGNAGMLPSSGGGVAASADSVEVMSSTMSFSELPSTHAMDRLALGLDTSTPGSQLAAGPAAGVPVSQIPGFSIHASASNNLSAMDASLAAKHELTVMPGMKADGAPGQAVSASASAAGLVPLPPSRMVDVDGQITVPLAGSGERRSTVTDPMLVGVQVGSPAVAAVAAAGRASTLRSGLPGPVGASMSGPVGNPLRWGIAGLAVARAEQTSGGVASSLDEARSLSVQPTLAPAAAAPWQTVVVSGGLVTMDLSWVRPLRDGAAEQVAADLTGETVSAWSSDVQAPVSQAAQSGLAGLGAASSPEAFARQVATQVQTWVVSSLRSADISLNSQMADAMQVRIELQGQDVSIHFRTDVVGTREVMAQQLDRLQGLLQAQGLNLADTSFGDFGQQERQGNGSSFTPTEAMGRTSEPSAIRTPVAALPRSGPAQGGRVGALDVFV